MTEQTMDWEAFFRERQRQEKEDKLARFRHLNPYVRKGQILFAGSSLMEQFPIYEFLLDFQLPYTIYNRGVGGFPPTNSMRRWRTVSLRWNRPTCF